MQDKSWNFQRHAETLEKATALYVDLKYLTTEAAISAVRYDHESRPSMNRFAAVEYICDYEAAVSTVKKRARNPQLWPDYLRYILTTAGLAESKFPAQRWRDMVSAFGRVLYERELHPYSYFRVIKKRGNG